VNCQNLFLEKMNEEYHMQAVSLSVFINEWNDVLEKVSEEYHMQTGSLGDFINEWDKKQGVRLGTTAPLDTTICWRDYNRGPRRKWSVATFLKKRVRPYTGNINIWVEDRNGKRVHGNRKIESL
jgi:hypothetical protein